MSISVQFSMCFATRELLFVGIKKFLSTIAEQTVSEIRLFDEQNTLVESKIFEKNSLISEVLIPYLDGKQDVEGTFEIDGQTIIPEWFPNKIFIYVSERQFAWISIDGGYSRLTEKDRLPKTEQKELCHTLLETIKQGITAANPDVAWLNAETISELAQSWVEYYNNPYYFCIEPSIDYDSEAVKETGLCSFLIDEHIQKQLVAIEEQFPREKLVEQLRKHAPGYFETSNGFGVIRSPGTETDPGSLGSDVYPRFFVRKALRNAGVELPPGQAERSAKELGVSSA